MGLDLIEHDAPPLASGRPRWCCRGACRCGHAKVETQATVTADARELAKAMARLHGGRWTAHVDNDTGLIVIVSNGARSDVAMSQVPRRAVLVDLLTAPSSVGAFFLLPLHRQKLPALTCLRDRAATYDRFLSRHRQIAEAYCAHCPRTADGLQEPSLGLLSG
jgi:hypothetical protein